MIKKVLIFLKKTDNVIIKLFKKVGKKKLAIIFGSLIVVIICGIYIIPFAPHYFNGNSALAAGDYYTAICEYERAGYFLNTKSKLNNTYYLYAEQLYSEENFYDASIYYNITKNYEDANDKLIQCGTELLENEQYKDAVEVFEMVETEDVAKMKNYASGMDSLNKGDYKNAKDSFKAADDYKSSQEMINVCDLMIAEERCKKGNFDEAQKIYSNLPDNCTYNGISTAGRISLLNNSKTLLDAIGKWEATDNYIESRNIHKRTGSWNNWYHGHDNVLSGQNLEISCMMNDDNTFNIKGELSFYKFDNYSSLSEYCKPKITTKAFLINNVTTIPSSYQIDDDTIINFSKGVFSIKYSKRDNYSSYFYNMYNSSVTYGKKQ